MQPAWLHFLSLYPEYKHHLATPDAQPWLDSIQPEQRPPSEWVRRFGQSLQHYTLNTTPNWMNVVLHCMAWLPTYEASSFDVQSPIHWKRQHQFRQKPWRVWQDHVRQHISAYNPADLVKLIVSDTSDIFDTTLSSALLTNEHSPALHHQIEHGLAWIHALPQDTPAYKAEEAWLCSLDHRSIHHPNSLFAGHQQRHSTSFAWFLTLWVQHLAWYHDGDVWHWHPTLQRIVHQNRSIESVCVSGLPQLYYTNLDWKTFWASTWYQHLQHDALECMQILHALHVSNAHGPMVCWLEDFTLEHVQPMDRVRYAYAKQQHWVNGILTSSPQRDVLAFWQEHQHIWSTILYNKT
jgi:hypothetical protein